MLYAVLCYNDEATVMSWTQAEDDAVMERLGKAHDKLHAKKQLGPAIRLLPTTSAATLRKNVDPPLVIDGPFAETKEQLLGFYLINGDDLEDVLTFCRELGAVNPGGAYEVRPLHFFANGSLPSDAVAAPDRVSESA